MIEVRNLSKVYQTPVGTVRVLDGLELTLGAGEAAAIVGPSGSGKTTLLNLLGALDRPTGGTIRINGRDIGGFTPAEAGRFRNRSLGFVFQQHHLLPQLDVLENVLVPRLAGGWDESAADTTTRARRLLEAVGMGHRLDHLPWQLSGGEQLRVALARALVNRPQLVLADEPTGMLDAVAAAQVAELLTRLNREEGVALIVVTHHLLLASAIGRTLELADGKLREVGG